MLYIYVCILSISTCVLLFSGLRKHEEGNKKDASKYLLLTYKNKRHQKHKRMS